MAVFEDASGARVEWKVGPARRRKIQFDEKTGPQAKASFSDRPPARGSDETRVGTYLHEPISIRECIRIFGQDHQIDIARHTLRAVCVRPDQSYSFDAVVLIGPMFDVDEQRVDRTSSPLQSC